LEADAVASQDNGLAVRVTALEAKFDIGQLAVRYSLAADSRDVAGLLALFEPREREVLRHAEAPEDRREEAHDRHAFGLDQFYRSVHQICGHIIELLTPTTARGKLYCRAEHEVGERYIVAALIYNDDYVKVDGEWLFAKRRPQIWYAADLLERPQEVDFASWSGSQAPELPGTFPMWSTFWQERDTAAITSHPVGEASTSNPKSGA